MSTTNRNVIDLPQGRNKAFRIEKQWVVPVEGFAIVEDILYNDNNLNDDVGGCDSSQVLITADELQRIKVSSGKDVTLPLALRLLDPETYSSWSVARKACRKGFILIQRRQNGSISPNCEGFKEERDHVTGRVHDRIYPFDVIGRQTRINGGFYPTEKALHEIPVLFEDDHIALVNKPEGLPCFSHTGGGYGKNSIRSQLPYALKEPAAGTRNALRRPQPAHRLDKPTSGILICAKTKDVLVDINNQFKARTIKKTYQALVCGIPEESSNKVEYEGLLWNEINSRLEEKDAITFWRIIGEYDVEGNRYCLLEMKPQTGRYHQLRRHLSWICKCPIVGDDDYGGTKDLVSPLLNNQGLFLCSSGVRLKHPKTEEELSSEIDLPKKFLSIINKYGK